MSIKKYEIFLKTVDLGSVTRASQVLNYSQSAISHVIASLEDELGLKLLIRGRSGVKLTSEGEKLIPAIRTICQNNQELLRQVSEFQGFEVGTIRIGAILSVTLNLLPQWLKTFSDAHPNLDFEIIQGNYEDIEQWINEGRVDFGFLREPTPSNLKSFLIRAEEFSAIFPQDRDVPEGPFPFSSLKNEPYILRPDTLEDDLSKLLKNANYSRKITYGYKDDFAVMALVEKGLGMSILPELLMQNTPYKLQKRPLDPPVFRRITLTYKSEESLSPGARSFVSYLRNLHEDIN